MNGSLRRASVLTVASVSSVHYITVNCATVAGLQRIERLGEREGIRCRAMQAQMLEPALRLGKIWPVSDGRPPKDVRGTTRSLKPLAPPVQRSSMQSFVHESTEILQRSPHREIWQRPLIPENSGCVSGLVTFWRPYESSTCSCKLIHRLKLFDEPGHAGMVQRFTSDREVEMDQVAGDGRHHGDTTCVRRPSDG